MSKITINIEFTKAEFKRMIKDAGLKITDKDKFGQIFASAEFAKTLAEDIKDVWIASNEEAPDIESIYDLMGLGDVVVDPEFED